MKFLRNKIFAAFAGSVDERRAVHDLLVFDEDKGSFLRPNGIMYAGLIDFVKQQLGNCYEIEVEDINGWESRKFAEISIPPDILVNQYSDHKLRDYQIITARKAVHKERGVIEIATGGGKTMVAAAIIQYLISSGLAKKAYVITGSTFLMNQAASSMEKFGLQGVSRYGGGNKFKPAAVQCCVVNSVARALSDGQSSVIEDLTDCDILVLDESHHLSSKSWISIAEACPARYRYGLTATLWADPFEFSHSDFYLIGLTGGVVAHVPSSYLRARGYLADPVVTMLTVNSPRVSGWKWDKCYRKGIVQHSVRNAMLADVAHSLHENEYKTLVFVGRVDHGMFLTRLLAMRGCGNVVFVKGGETMYRWKPSGRWEKSKTSVEDIAVLVRDSKEVTVIGTQLLDEGVDFPSFNALVMGTAMKKYRRTVQRAGRGMRPKPGNNKVYIFDFIDAVHDVLLKHSMYRLKTYELEEYTMSQSIDETCERMGAPIILETKSLKWKDPKR